MINNAAVPIYNAEFGPAVANLNFVTTQPGVNNIQVANAQRPGALHLTFHQANTNVFAGCMTVDAAQGTDAQNVYLHLFAGDELAYANNAHALPLALSRCQQTVTITVPAGTRNNSPLVQGMLRRGLALNQLVRRGATVFGSRLDAVSHGFTSLDDLDHEEAAIPALFNDEVVPTHLNYAGRSIVIEDDDELADDTPTVNLISPAIAEALYQLHPEPPQPADLTRDKTIIRFRKPDPACRIRVPEWIASLDLHEPTIYRHIGYPFSNTEVLASVLAVFDRYTKPQNVAIPNKRAFFLADIMFERWVAAFIRPDAVVQVPSVAAMFSHWFDRAKALRIAQVAEQLPFIDSGRPLQNEYFLKCQCKPKFGAFGFCTECGQGILATNKLLNATICPLIVQATKIMQSMFKVGVIYDSGYSADQLDDAVRATGAHRCKESMSIDLKQQDSSHVNVHRFFIAKVLAFLGFDDTICTLYLMSRARRFCKGLTMLGLLFEVIERLFSGEPGTALFNFLMSTGTSVCTFDFSRMRVFLAKGDDNTVVPVLPKLKLAVNMVRETGVTQKIDILPYLDFANRIWTTTGRSFMDPARALAKYTMRMSKRDNSVNEQIAFSDHHLTCNDREHEELTWALVAKHKVEYTVAHELVSAVQTLALSPATYYQNLRPSKIPVDFMPTIRNSGKHEVVFENLQDQCAPAAIAFIADVPVHDVMNYVAMLRLKNGIHPDIRDANRSSPHPAPFFMSADEIRLAAAKFGVRRSGADVSLKLEKRHVVVVRGKFSWRSDVVAGIFGSRTYFGAFTILCLCIAWAYQRRAVLVRRFANQLYTGLACIQERIVMFATLLSPMAFCISALPPVLLVYLTMSFKWPLYLFIASQSALRLFLLPFHYRALKTSTYKKVSGVRVQHAMYGNITTRSYNVDKALFTWSCALVALVFALLCIRDIAWLWTVLNYKDYPSDELILGIGWILAMAGDAYLFSQTALGSSIMWCAFGIITRLCHFNVPLVLACMIPATFQAVLWTKWVLLPYGIMFAIGFCYAKSIDSCITHRGLFWFGQAMFWFRFWLNLQNMSRYVYAWSEAGKDPWLLWWASNVATFDDEQKSRAKYKFKMPRWTQWTHWFPKDDPIEQYMDACVRTKFEKRGKAGRQMMRTCHPDKSPFPSVCAQALGVLIGTGEQRRPAECD
jgi:hypothetical protein